MLGFATQIDSNGGGSLRLVIPPLVITLLFTFSFVMMHGVQQQSFKAASQITKASPNSAFSDLPPLTLAGNGNLPADTPPEVSTSAAASSPTNRPHTSATPLPVASSQATRPLTSPQPSIQNYESSPNHKLQSADQTSDSIKSVTQTVNATAGQTLKTLKHL